METLEQLQARHRKEQRDLQSRITQKKKSATKKTRKGVNSECEELERQLKVTHDREVIELDGGAPDATDHFESDPENTDKKTILPQPISPPQRPLNGLADDLQKASVSDIITSEDGEPRKRNRQRERLARRAAEQEAAAVEAEVEAAKLPNWKRQERTAMLKAFKDNSLVEKEIAPDGHCMFSAVADQLSEAGIPVQEGGDAAPSMRERYRAVRQVAAKYLEDHPDEFAGFLDEPLNTYANKIRDTAEWGGQVELIALSKSYNVEICVIQDGRIDRFEPGSESGKGEEKLWLAYYRHGYGLGEHYNSLRKAP